MTVTFPLASFPIGGVTNSRTIRIFEDADHTTKGSVTTFALDTTPNKAIFGGGLAALRDNVDYAAVGSSWRVTEAGRFRNFDLANVLPHNVPFVQLPTIPELPIGHSPERCLTRQ